MGVPLILTVCCTFACLACYTSFAAAADILTPDQNLTDGQTLVSSNQRFELGFFSLGNSGRKYLGIWYYNIPLTVVWVGNKDNPMDNSSCRLTMSSNGALFLYNSSMSVVWSTNETVTGKSSPVLQILGSGNLVVRDGNEYIWQSFDHMSDTLLPGMRLGWKLKTHINRQMTSWKSIDDPSDGAFTFSLDPPETPQLNLRNGSEKRYRWGPFDGDRFSGSNELKNNPIFKPVFISTPDEVYYTYDMLDESILSRFIVTQTGAIQYFTWINQSREWSMSIEINRDYCDRYGLCGPYGNCYSADPNCRCLDGFSPRSPQDWRLIYWNGGCKRNYELNCSKNDGFVKYTKLKLPDNVTLWSNYSVEECGAACLKNCDCMAYTAINPQGNGSQCVVWFGELLDFKNFPNGGEELYIRMARAEIGLYLFSAFLLHEGYSYPRLCSVISTVAMLYVNKANWKLWSEGNALELADEILEGSYSESEVIRCIQVALLCLQQRAEERPTMSPVVFMLSNANAELPQPKEPDKTVAEILWDRSLNTKGYTRKKDHQCRFIFK